MTIADREAEQALAKALTALRPDACVGEEAYAADPSFFDGLDRGAVWIVG